MTLLRESNQFVNFIDLLHIKFGSEITGRSEISSIYRFWQWINSDPSEDNTSTETTADLIEYFKGLRPDEFPSWISDTSLGGNEAINSWYQYNPDDDISHDGFMGRVYRKNIENNKQLLHLSFGLPHLNNIVAFYNSAILSKVRGQAAGRLSENDPDYQRITFLRIATHKIVGFSRVAWNGLWNWSVGTGAGELDVPINGYYDIRPEMALYHKHVNTILIKLAIAMDILERTEKRLDPNREDSYMSADALPDPLADTGLDIALIRARRRKLINNLIGPTAPGGENNQLNSTDHTLSQHDERKTTQETTKVEFDYLSANNEPQQQSVFDYTITTVKNWFGDYKTTFLESTSRGYEFIAFKVDADISTSESFSNSTTSNSVSELLSGVADTIRDLYYSTSNNTNALAQELGLDTAVQRFGTDVAEIFFDGNRIVIPKIWGDSEHSASHSFNLTLRTHYGDPFSIFQDIYVPLACILAGVLPRSTGLNSYTNPFLVRAYATGMTSIPLGIIDSLTIERGSDHFGFNKDFLPLSLDVSFTIKDLTNSMPMGSDMPPLRTTAEALYQFAARTDSALTDYLGTLGGITVYERLYRHERYSRAARLAASGWFNNFFNPSRFGQEFLHRFMPGFGHIVRQSGSVGLPGN